MNTLDFLSIWEVAHRWRGFDPDESTAKKIPLPVKDSIRSLAQALIYESLLPYDDRGLTRHRGYSMEALYPQLKAIVDGQYDVPFLKRVHIAKHEIVPWCNTYRIPAPAFWFTAEEVTAATALHELRENRRLAEANKDTRYVLCDEDGTEQEVSADVFFGRTGGRTEASEPPTLVIRRSQEDRQLCQAIARTLWDVDPTLTIAALTKHPSILKYGNGAHYKSKTLHTWIAEIDPRDKKEETGRPSKDPAASKKPPA